MTRPRLTDTDWQIIRSALNHAIDEREALADAYSNTGPEAKQALMLVAEYEALHQKMFGTPSSVTANRHRMAEIPLVSIFDIWDKKPVDEPED